MQHLLVEPAIVPDIFTSGLAEAEDLGDGNIRFTLYARQTSYCSPDRHVEHVIVARLIMPVGAVHHSVQMTMKALGVACCGGERMRLAH